MGTPAAEEDPPGPAGLVHESLAQRAASACRGPRTVDVDRGEGAQRRIDCSLIRESTAFSTPADEQYVLS